MTARRLALAIWVAGLLACLLIVTRLHIETDMGAFLPRGAAPAQRVLVDQFRDGVISRLVLLGIEDADADQAVALNKRLAASLRKDSRFVTVENGEESGFGADRTFLWSHRYLLSDSVTPGHFSPDQLRLALERDLDELGSAAGFLVKDMLPGDPTGEMLHLITQQQAGGTQPDRRNGVWVADNGHRSLMLLRLRAGGADIDAEQQALETIKAQFQDAKQGVTSAPRLLLTGAPVFAVESRDRIKSDATRLSVLASVIVAGALLLVYRSPRVLLLSFIPVVSGALAGIAAVGLAFGHIHGITLGFGATLIGEAVDYAVYLFTQTGPDSPVEQTIRRIWPTLRLGVLTSICGFAAMLLSSFNGFAQLGLFTISGLAVAVCVTRWVLPALLPARFVGVRQSAAMMRVASLAAKAHRLRPAVLILLLIAAGSLLLDTGPFWASDLMSLSPVPIKEQSLDRQMRRDMRAPEAASLIVIRRPDQQAALEAADQVAARLPPLIAQGALTGFDTPTRYLPSLATQRKRQAALPDAPALQAGLETAQAGLPFQPGLFDPFLKAVAEARTGPLITRQDLDGTSLSLKLDSLLQQQGNGWVAMLSLAGVTRPEAIQQAIEAEPETVFVNLKAESDRLLGVYLREGASLALLGAGGIVLLLAISLRSLSRLVLIMAPLTASVLVTLAVLRLGGQALSIFNLFGLLLVVAIGSNYCLFFDRQRHDPAGLPRVLASMLLANGCTVAGFGVLAISRTPVLHGLGMPVAIGTLVSLIFATIIMSPVPTIDHAAAS